MTVQEREHSKPAVRKRSSWGSGATMLDRIFEDGSAFNFYQAVKILSHLYGGARPPANRTSHGRARIHSDHFSSP